MDLPPKPNRIQNLEFVRILTPYIFSCSIIKKKSVLDVGCGSGEGAWLLVKNGASLVVALDFDQVKARQASNLCKDFRSFSALTMDAQKIGFKDQSFQVITCFEVIEHLPNPDLHLSEMKRIMRMDGILILTTPNKKMRLLPLQRPWNLDHLFEYNLRSLRIDLKKHFSFIEILGIYGEPKLNEYYGKIWHQNPFRVYLGWGVRIMLRLTPNLIIEMFKNKTNYEGREKSIVSEPGLLNMAIATPDPENWPFYVSEVNKHCLNFVAICGFNKLIIEKAANEIKRST
jgi:ubiquinone/menaquinone biosynthesis C-methylase UbiE